MRLDASIAAAKIEGKTKIAIYVIAHGNAERLLRL
jgi:hypothetical protein